MISEAFDRSDGIYDRDNRRRHRPGSWGCHLRRGHAVHHARVIERARDVVPGDIFLVNDPYCGGTHLMDVKMVKPFFYRSTGRGWPTPGTGRTPAARPRRLLHARHRGPAGGAAAAPVKLFRAGVIDDDLLQIVLANIRVPEERIGDIKAQVAALTVGERLTACSTATAPRR